MENINTKFLSNQMIIDWIGEPDGLKKFSCRFGAVDYPRLMKNLFEPKDGGTWWCKGKVTAKYVRNGSHYIECDIWIENGKGERTTSGHATAELPTRG